VQVDRAQLRRSATGVDQLQGGDTFAREACHSPRGAVDVAGVDAAGHPVRLDQVAVEAGAQVVHLIRAQRARRLERPVTLEQPQVVAVEELVARRLVPHEQLPTVGRHGVDRRAVGQRQLPQGGPARRFFRG
jgi:hypothetical protein